MTPRPFRPRRPRTRPFFLTLALLLACGEVRNPAREAIDRSEPVMAPAPLSAAAASWSCPMHPDVVQSAPGLCPECGMDLLKRG